MTFSDKSYWSDRIGWSISLLLSLILQIDIKSVSLYIKLKIYDLDSQVKAIDYIELGELIWLLSGIDNSEQMLIPLYQLLAELFGHLQALIILIRH